MTEVELVFKTGADDPIEEVNNAIGELPPTVGIKDMEEIE
jgi:hypothetical protein